MNPFRRAPRAIALLLSLALFLPQPAWALRTPSADSEKVLSGLEEALKPGGTPEMRTLGTLQLGRAPAEILAHRGDRYLRIPKEFLRPGNLTQGMWHLPLEAQALVTLGTGAQNTIPVTGVQPGGSISRRQSAILLDFGGAIQALDLGSDAGTWVGGRQLRPPRFFHLAGLRYFLFQRGNRYFIAGERIEGPDRLFVPFQEIPFHGTVDERNRRLQAVATLGREPSNDIQIHDAAVSRSHAELLLMDDGSVWIQDLGSANGTRIGGKKISRPMLLYSPVNDFRQIQGEIWSPLPGFGEMMQRVREIALLDLGPDARRIREAVQDLNHRLGELKDPALPLDLYFAMTTHSAEDDEARFTIAMENYLGFFVERFLSRLRTFGGNEPISDNAATLLLFFLLDRRYPRLQYEAAAGLRELRLPDRLREEVAHRVFSRLITTEPARNFFGRLLLETLGNLRGAKQLMKLLESGDLDVSLRADAIRVLGEHAQDAPGDDLFDLLKKLSFSESKPVVLAAMDALARTGRKEAAIIFSAYAFPADAGQVDPEVQAKAEALFHQLVQGLIDEKVRKTEEPTQIIRTPRPEPPPDEPSPPPAAGLEEVSAPERADRRIAQLLSSADPARSDPYPLTTEEAFGQLESFEASRKEIPYLDGRMLDFRGKLPGGVQEVWFVSDLHAQWSHLANVLRDPGNLERLQQGKAILLILGDAEHPEDPGVGMESSIVTLQLILDLMIRAPAAVFYVLGNHSVPWRDYRLALEARYGSEYAKRYEQAFLQNTPVGVVGDRFAAVHGRPPEGLAGAAEEILNRIKEVPYEKLLDWKDYTTFSLLWSSLAEEGPLLASQKAKRFLEQIGQPDGILVGGHLHKVDLEKDPDQYRPFYLIYSGAGVPGGRYLVYHRSSGSVEYRTPATAGLEEKAQARPFDRKEAVRLIRRGLFRKDASVWERAVPGQGADIVQWLGWVEAPGKFLRQTGEIREFARQVRAEGIEQVALIGTGGSLWGAVTLERFLRARKRAGYPDLIWLDLTDPRAIRRFEQSIRDPSRTLFVVVSKSGTNKDVNYLFRHLRSRFAVEPNRIVAITDPGQRIDGEDPARFRRLFRGDPQIGGRFSIFSPFGLVPSALSGVDVRPVLRSAAGFQRRLRADPEGTGWVVPLTELLLKHLAEGRDKWILRLPQELAPLGPWLQQLFNESLGKGLGAPVLVADEPEGQEPAGRRDRLILELRPSARRSPRPVQEAPGPAPRLILEVGPPSRHLGSDLYQWQVTAALLGYFLGVHPFNQPDVEKSKQLATEALTTPRRPSRLEPFYERQGIRMDINPIVEREWRRKGLLRARPESAEAMIREFLSLVPDRAAVALLAYADDDPTLRRELQRIRGQILQRTGRTTLLGIGPRYLHSDLQLQAGKKGIVPIFFTFEPDQGEPVPIVPGEPFDFSEFTLAQARGNFRRFEELKMPALRVHLPARFREDPRRISALFGAGLEEEVNVPGPNGPITWGVPAGVKQVIDRLSARSFTVEQANNVIPRRLTKLRAIPSDRREEFFKRRAGWSFWILEHLSDERLNWSALDRAQMARALGWFTVGMGIGERGRKSSFGFRTRNPDSLEAWWYVLVRLLVLEQRLEAQGAETEGVAAHKELIGVLYHIIADLAYVAFSHYATVRQDPRDFYDSKLIDLGIAQPDLRAVIQRVRDGWKKWEGASSFFGYLTEPSYFLEQEGDVELELDDEDLDPTRIQKSQEVVHRLAELEEILTPKTAEAVEAWEHPLRYLEKIAHPAEMVFFESVGERVVRIPGEEFPDVLAFQLDWLDRMGRLGFKQWALTSVIDYLRPIQQWAADQKDRRLLQDFLEQVQDYLGGDGRVSLTGFLLLGMGPMPENVKHTLHFWERLGELKRAHRAQVALFQDSLEDPIPLTQWIEKTAGRRLVLGPLSRDYTPTASAVWVDHVGVSKSYHIQRFDLFLAMLHVPYRIGEKLGWGEDHQSSVIPIAGNRRLAEFSQGGERWDSDFFKRGLEGRTALVVTPREEDDDDEGEGDEELVPPEPEGVLQPAGSGEAAGLEERMPGWLRAALPAEEFARMVRSVHAGAAVMRQPVAVLFDPTLISGASVADRQVLLAGLEESIRSTLALPEGFSLRFDVLSERGRLEQAGFRAIEVLRHPDAGAAPLPEAALALVVAQALTVPQGPLYVDPIFYAGLEEVTLPEALSRLTDLFA